MRVEEKRVSELLDLDVSDLSNEEARLIFIKALSFPAQSVCK